MTGPRLCKKRMAAGGNHEGYPYKARCSDYPTQSAAGVKSGTPGMCGGLSAATPQTGTESLPDDTAWLHLLLLSPFPMPGNHKGCPYMSLFNRGIGDLRFVASFVGLRRASCSPSPILACYTLSGCNTRSQRGDVIGQEGK